MLPTKWPLWIIIPISLLLVAVIVGAGLGLATAVQASVPPVEVAPSPTSIEEGSMQNPDLLAYAHAEEGLECLVCHLWEEAMAEGSSTQRTVDANSLCYGCHVENEHASYDQIVELTADLEEEVGANPHASHYGDMPCRLCHKTHRESEDYCAQCHEWGWQVP